MKACPFCGERELHFSNKKKQKRYVCKYCRSAGPVALDEAGAAVLWEMRERALMTEKAKKKIAAGHRRYWQKLNEVKL
jgi:hypothetical protein